MMHTIRQWRNTIGGIPAAWRALPLAARIERLRWLAPLGVLPLVAIHKFVTFILFEGLPIFWHVLSEWALYGLTGTVAVWLSLSWMERAVQRQADDAARLAQANSELSMLNRRLIAIHQLSREMVTASDPVEVLELAVRAPTQLAGARGSAIFTFDGREQLKLEMTSGLGDSYVRALSQRFDAGLLADRCRSCEPLTARVTGTCPLYTGVQDQARADGLASLACLPLTCDQRRIGVIGSFFDSPDGPPEAQLSLLNIVGAEVAGALEGVQLRARQMATLATVGQAPQHGEDLDSFLGSLLDTILSGWKFEAGAILLHGDGWHRSAAIGMGDATDDPRYAVALRLAEHARGSCSPATLAAPQAGSYVSAVALPLQGKDGVMGVLFLGSSRVRSLNAAQLTILSLLAHETALAARNAQLHLQLGHVGVLEERYRLSREMHDGLAQTVSFLGLGLDRLATLLKQGRTQTAAAEIDGIREAVREAYVDVREAIDGLRLSVDHPGGLSAVLQKVVIDFSGRTGITATFESSGSLPELTPLAGLQLLRIAQEALTNIRKHADAQSVRVSLAVEDGNCVLCVADDGRGFDAGAPRSRRHVGLEAMRERAQGLGGSVTISADPGRGARITARAPVDRNHA